VLIFFHIETGLVEPVPTWLSWLLVGGVFTHVLSNWKQFKGCFSRNTGLDIIGTSMLVTAVAVMPFLGEGDDGNKEKRTARSAVKALESSSLKILALVMKKAPEALEEQLAMKGLKNINRSMSIAEIAAGNGMENEDVLGGLISGNLPQHDASGDYKN
jgi:hypothetical protein